jgi:adenosyl cobinamide kinase/adenosyl cobinamide phosphate guanylyltransferase
MSVTQLTAWVRGAGATMRWALALLAAAFALGGYVVTARATDSDHEERIRRLENMAEDTSWNAWAACVASQDKLPRGIQCRDLRSK